MPTTVKETTAVSSLFQHMSHKETTPGIMTARQRHVLGVSSLHEKLPGSREFIVESYVHGQASAVEQQENCKVVHNPDSTLAGILV